MSTGGRRALAVVAVVVMIGAALLVRGLLEGDDGHHERQATLMCAAELGDVCQAIADAGDVTVETEPAGTTAQALEAVTDPKDVKFDGWLTIAPRTGIVNDAQDLNQRGHVFAPDETLARSPLVFVGRKDRMTKLAAHCGSTSKINWNCLGGLAGTPWSAIGGDPTWNQVVLGHADPTVNTGGLLAIGQEATSKLDRDHFARDDIEANDFSNWFLNLEENVETGGAEGPLVEMLQFGAGIDVAQVTEAEACTRLPHAALVKALEVVVPTPITTADVVFAPVHGRTTAGSLRDAVNSDAAKHALAAASWRVGDVTKRATVCKKVGPVQLPQSSNAPDAGALAALLDLRGR